MSESPRNGWNQWENHVLRELERMNQGLEAMRDELGAVRASFTADLQKLQLTALADTAKLKVELAVLKTKVALIGAGSGLGTVAVLEGLLRVLR